MQADCSPEKVNQAVDEWKTLCYTERRKGGETVNHAYFAGGCFWCITPILRDTPGVLRVTSGYSGGEEKNPTYEDVKYQRTGHRETIWVEFDDTVSFDSLLEVFLGGVDPFDEGGQFIDRGHSYTLAIYYTDSYQRSVAETAIAALEKASGRIVHIAVEPFSAFYAAEEYHQNYDLKNPEEFQQELIESGRKTK